MLVIVEGTVSTITTDTAYNNKIQNHPQSSILITTFSDDNMKLREREH
jgi:hypothetical protein